MQAAKATEITKYQERKAPAEIRGEFLRTNVRVNCPGDFSVDFFFAIFLGKHRRIKSTQIHSKIKIRIGDLRPKSTLQGSALHKIVKRYLKMS